WSLALTSLLFLCAGVTGSSARIDRAADAPTSVSLVSPAANSQVSGAVTVSASAEVGVASVQFKLDGLNLGAPATTAPYATSWDWRRAMTGAHVLVAVARDSIGNETTSGPVTVDVENNGPPAGSTFKVTVAGPMETVYSASTQACYKKDIADQPVRALVL